MNAFLFGSSRRPLFGVHHPPTAGSARDTGVVLCAPFGQEYMRTHRALRQLAIQLARAGFHVLRFDYFGTGDSSGDGEEATIAQWLEDVDTAAEELRDATGLSAVSLVGIRFGAMLAATAATRAGVDTLVLWDPVADGRAYAAELLPTPLDHEVNVNGFPVTPTLRREIAALDLLAGPAPRARRIVIIASEERPEYRRLEAHLAAVLPGRVTLEHIPCPGDWEDMDRLGAALLPQAIIQGIVRDLTEVAVA